MRPPAPTPVTGRPPPDGRRRPRAGTRAQRHASPTGRLRPARSRSESTGAARARGRAVALSMSLAGCARLPWAGMAERAPSITRAPRVCVRRNAASRAVSKSIALAVAATRDSHRRLRRAVVRRRRGGGRDFPRYRQARDCRLAGDRCRKRRPRGCPRGRQLPGSVTDDGRELRARYRCRRAAIDRQKDELLTGMADVTPAATLQSCTQPAASRPRGGRIAGAGGWLRPGSRPGGGTR